MVRRTNYRLQTHLSPRVVAFKTLHPRSIAMINRQSATAGAGCKGSLDSEAARPASTLLIEDGWKHEEHRMLASDNYLIYKSRYPPTRPSPPFPGYGSNPNLQNLETSHNGQGDGRCCRSGRFTTSLTSVRASPTRFCRPSDWSLHLLGVL